MKKLLFIFNPKSGKALIKNKLMDIVDIFIKGGYSVQVHSTQEAHDAYEQTKALAGEVDLVVCSGGDGTLNEVVTGLIDSQAQTPLGYIPSGSTNDFAVSLAIPKDMLRAAKAVVEGQLFACDVGAFNDDTFVYIAAFGVFTDVSYQTDQGLKNVLGHMAYLLEGMKRIFEIESYYLTIETSDKVFDGEFIFGMVTNSRSVGGFKKLTGKNVQLDDGLFEVTFIRKPRNPLELNEILASLLAAEDNTELIESFKTNAVKIVSEQQIPWTLDGEFGGEHSNVDILNRKHALHILLNPKQRKVELPLIDNEA